VIQLRDREKDGSTGRGQIRLLRRIDGHGAPARVRDRDGPSWRGKSTRARIIGAGHAGWRVRTFGEPVHNWAGKQAGAEMAKRKNMGPLARSKQLKYNMLDSHGFRERRMSDLEVPISYGT